MEAEKEVLGLLWLRGLLTPFRPLSLNITREVCAYLLSSALCLVLAFRLDFASLYDLDRRTVVSATLARSLDSGVKLCVVSRRKALCFGGNGPSSLVFSLLFSDFRLCPEKSMSVARSSAGVLLYRRNVYVFGGRPSVRSCEKLNLNLFTWHSLPNLLGSKHSFTPCRHHQSIYLPEARQACLLEVFDISTETITALEVAMPFQDGASTAIMHGEEMTIVTSKGELGKWSPGKGQFEVVSLGIGTESKLFCSSQPVLWAGKGYWAAFFSCNLAVLDLDWKQCLFVSEVK